MRFENKVVLITGSASGIGKATAIRFAEEGAKLIINSKNNVTGGQEVVDHIESLGRQAVYVQADVSDPVSAKGLFAQIRDKFGRLDVLVNNAGSTVIMPFLETTKEHWMEAFNTNLITAVLCSIEAATLMQEQGQGSIINTSSIRGLDVSGREGIMAYSAAKAALINFTTTLAKELAPDITVNAVAPGFVYKPAYDNFPDELREDFVGSTLIKRFIEPHEIADAYLYLAGTPVVTGEVLVVDGGFRLKLS